MNRVTIKNCVYCANFSNKPLLAMTNNEIGVTIILSERGRDSAIIGVFKYKILRLRKNGDLLKW